MTRWILLCLFLLTTVGCVKENPAYAGIIEKVRADLEANYQPGIGSQIEKITIFNDSRMKVYVVPEFKQEDLKAFTKAAAEAFGKNARTNGVIATDYELLVFQTQLVKATGKETQINVAEGIFHNGKETTEVNLFGQGSDRYSYE